AHATKEEAISETKQMINVYAKFAESFMAMPVVIGTKTESERFAGALETYCIESLMQDGKALQAGTSHFLGQNFAKAFDVKFATKEGKQDYVWATSWGVSTRLMGALIMTHSDDAGLVLPPKLAPYQVVIVPIYKGEEQLEAVSEVALKVKKELESLGVSVKFDNRDTHKPGWKFAEYELKGVPLRLALGNRDLENGTIEVARRDTMEKETLQISDIGNKVVHLLDNIQENLFTKANSFREENTFSANTYDEFKALIEKGGFVYAHWDGRSETEEKIKKETKATIRCIPESRKFEEGTCIYSGEKSTKRVLFAKAY
ncbi:MAG: proline--tRNA ligase, partial [Flavobacteriales bacterium]|nr:proline--tRNA ligase [Flavobacteriales bacterium]